MKTPVTCFAIVLVALSAGCGTAISEGAGQAFGPKGEVTPLQPVTLGSSLPLQEYSQFELGEFHNDVGGHLPAALLPQFRIDFPAMLAKYKVKTALGGKTAVIRGTILHYEGSGSLAVVTSAVEEIVVRTEIADKESGRVIAVANCIGRSTTRLNRGIDKKAEGLAKAVAKWIALLQHNKDQPDD
ncbi:MAG: hypothetical protein ABFD92_03510 [Planctomycetaceae bacterium]|nr:hypothetical protein [Planctomycetaceae bacterium]